MTRRFAGPVMLVFIALASLALAACGADVPTSTAAPAATATVATTAVPTAPATATTIPTATPTTAPTTSPRDATATTPPTLAPATVPTATAPAATATRPATPTPPAAPTATAGGASGPLSVTLPPSQDATIYESSADISNGSGEYLFAGNTNRDLSRRALVRFDIAGSIPAGSIIFSVRVEMRMNKTVAAPASLDLHRLSASWDEGSTNASGNEGRGLTAAPGDVSWNATSAGGDAWARRGGDFEDQTSATATAGSTNGSTITWSSTDGLVADVQAWLDDPTNNHGWIVVGDETGPQTAKRINSRHGAFGPELIIEYAELVLG